MLYSTIPYYTILYYTILYCMKLHNTILYYNVLYYTVLHYAILYSPIQYHTIPGRALAAARPGQRATRPKGFKDEQINWFCDEGPGYPRYQQMSLRNNDEAIVPEYTVITTNTNWYMYGHFEQRILFNIIFSLALKNPSEIFIWCPHPAEIQKGSLLHNMLAVKPQNIFLYGLTKEIYFNGIDTTEDVIKHAANGISTVSSCLLDYEIHETPVMLFESDGLSEIIKSIDVSSSFRTTDEFEGKRADLIKTNKLHPYKVAV